MRKRGCVVISSAGKDKGTLLAVLRVEPDGVWIADGRHRPLERPKRKNPRHVADTLFTLEETSMATNRELRRALTAVKHEPSHQTQAAATSVGGYHHMREVI